MTISKSAYELQLKGCIRLTKLAGMYFRNCSRADLARRMFITAIEEDKELHSRLKTLSFSFDNEIVKPKQITQIVNCWGYPDDFMINGHRKEHPAHETNL